MDTLIGKDTIFKGSISANGLIRIDGQLVGEIVTKGDVVIGEGAKVLAEIKARNLTVAGSLNGNVQIQERLEIRGTGVLTGNINTKLLSIDEGASFSGNSEMESKAFPEKGKGKEQN